MASSGVTRISHSPNPWRDNFCSCFIFFRLAMDDEIPPLGQPIVQALTLRRQDEKDAQWR
jgi:hypothetical protein